MDPSKRNAAALHQRIDEICDNMSTQFSSLFAAAAKQPDTSLAETSINELRIKEESTALVRSAEDIATLIRDLQEIWLFGGLDTLTDPVDAQAERDKALSLAAQIEVLARKKMAFAAPKQEEEGQTKVET